MSIAHHMQSSPKHGVGPKVGRCNSKPDETPDHISVVAYDLAKYTSFFFIGRNEGPQDIYEATLEKVLVKLKDQHDLMFSDAVKHLDKSSLATPEGFKRVIDSMLADDKKNWGRLVTIYCFAGYVIEFESRRRGGVERDQLARMLGQYVTDNLGPWIRENGGWDGMVEFFKSPTDDLWKKALYAGLTLSAFGTMALFKVFKS